MDNKFINKDSHSSKVYLITGSSLGIGFDILSRLSKEGATVILTSRRESNLKKAEERLVNLGIKNYCKITCNFNNKDERTKLFKLIEDKYNKLDGLVLNIAVNPYFGDMLKINEKEMIKIFNVNLFNTFLTIKESLPLLLKNSNYIQYMSNNMNLDNLNNKISIDNKSPHPSILIISSQAAFTPFDKIGMYSISKTALVSLTKILAKELVHFNCRINCIAPGIIKTRFASAILSSELANSNFMKRVGDSNEIVGLASYLLSEDASFITGETISINGGLNGRF